jgi:predicted alpha-1,6-mannanase (GH76 family)
MAQLIFADMAGGWDTTTCGGGIWWSKDKTYKNAIANELFLSVAAHLANRVEKHQRAQYETWSQREWTWFTSSGMINDQNLINDGLDSSNASACKNNGKSTWSYNQGVILGGLAEFSDFSRDRNVLIQAARIANSAIRHLTDANGILHDSCEPNCGADGPQFKGIFMRNLVQLNAKSPTAAYKLFANANADELWNDAQGPNHSFGLVWSGPFDVADASRQSSALDAIIAAAVMNEDHRQSRL